MTTRLFVLLGTKKGAFILGGKFGRGFILCRKEGGLGWSAPAASASNRRTCRPGAAARARKACGCELAGWPSSPAHAGAGTTGA